VSGPLAFLLVSLGVCVVGSAWQVAQVVAAGGLGDNAARRGSPVAGVLYSATLAMLPWKKESARLHPISYVLGVIYHLGTFLGFFWLAALALGAGAAVSDPGTGALASTAGNPWAWFARLSAVALGLAAIAGLALLVKRVVTPALRYYSSPDDYFSNALVTTFQVVGALSLLRAGLAPVLFVVGGAVLIYLPFGKLRHAVYYLPVRILLGLFYGRRGVWPGPGARPWRD
jgi:nitrate reductase gamma subunit